MSSHLGRKEGGGRREREGGRGEEGGERWEKRGRHTKIGEKGQGHKNRRKGEGTPKLEKRGTKNFPKKFYVLLPSS